MDTQTRFIQIRAVLGVPQSSSKLGQNKVKKEKHFETLTNKFLERGYPVEVVDDNLKKGLALDRTYPSQAVPVPTGTPKPRCMPTFIVTYNPHNPPLKKWLSNTFHILQADPNMAKIYNKPPAVTFRQPRSVNFFLSEVGSEVFLSRIVMICFHLDATNTIIPG